MLWTGRGRRLTARANATVDTAPPPAPRTRHDRHADIIAADKGQGPGFNAHRVPNLKLNLLAVDRDHARAELDTDGEVVDRLEA